MGVVILATSAYFLLNKENKPMVKAIASNTSEQHCGIKRSFEKNTAKTVILGKSDKEYEVGKDFHPGYYDVTSISSKTVNFAGDNLRGNEELKGIFYCNNNKIGVRGEGQVKLKPAKFEKLKRKNDYYTISKSGYYVVGSEMPEGKYEFALEKSPEPLYIFIDIRNKKLEPIDSIQWDNKKNARSISFNLKKGDQLYIDKKDRKRNENQKIQLKMIEVKEDSYY